MKSAVARSRIVALAAVAVFFSGAASAHALDLKVNFQPAGAVTPAGYLADTGQGYSGARGYGFIHQNDGSPFDINSSVAGGENNRMRERNIASDQRLDTVAHLAVPGSQVAVIATTATAAAWEASVPNGDYIVTVAAGDPSAYIDSINRVNVEGTKAIDFASSSSVRSKTEQLTVHVGDGKLRLDSVGGTNTKLQYVEILTVPAPADVDFKINFAPAGAPAVSGYTKDTGAAFDAARGYGWVTQASLANATHSPFDATAYTRDRNLVDDQRVDTLIHMQFTGGTPAAWEAAVPNGQYDVTFGVGDASSPFNSTNVINVEGQNALTGHVTSPDTRFRTKSATASVIDGRLTIDAIGGINTKLDWVTIERVSGAARPSVGTINPADGATLVSRSGSVSAGVNAGAGIDPATVNTSNVRLERVTDGALVPGAASISGGGGVIAFQPSGLLDKTTEYRFLITNAVKDTTGAAFEPKASSFTTNAEDPGTSAGAVTLTNLDTVPNNTRLSFSRIGYNPGPAVNGVHDTGTMRIRNTGSGPLQITGLPVTAGFTRISPTSLPVTLAVNATLDVTVKYVAFGGAGQVRMLHNGTLTIQTDSATDPSTTVNLSGYWQQISEGNIEPTLQELVNGVFGYKTIITGPGQTLDLKGKAQATGDEVMNGYWRKLDPSAPVGVRQLAAYHARFSCNTCSTDSGPASISYYLKGGDSTRYLFGNLPFDSQSILPHLNGSPTTYAFMNVTAPAQFGLFIDGYWSDDAKNSQTNDHVLGCVGACGHHVRAWPVKNESGTAVPGAYVIGQDYSNVSYANYDFQDNVYLLTNVTPDVGQTLIRIDTGSSSSYTDTAGRVWSPDTGLFSPSSAPNEGTATSAIANTSDDRLYATYRGNVGSATPRTLSYAIPTTASKVDVRLHFAERFNTAANARVFDVSAEGAPRLSNVDIFARAGGKDTAWTEEIKGVDVNGGVLNLGFTASKDYPAISGIEVLCGDNATGC